MRALLLAALSAFAMSSGDQEFLSVSVPKANVRKAPSEKAPLAWVVYKFAPLEVVAYRGDWIRVRDYEGDEGWMSKSLLTSEVPTTCVAVKEAKVHQGPGSKTKAVWVLERGYALRLFGAKGDWYEVSDLDEVSGWVHKSALWGMEPPTAPPLK